MSSPSIDDSLAGGPEAFLTRMSVALTAPSGRPITFIVGSGLSDGAVPDVGRSTAIATTLLDRYPQALAGFDPTHPVDDRCAHYQEALRLIGSYMGSPQVKGFVQELTLAAYLPQTPQASAALASREEFEPLSPDTCKLLEQDRRGWKLPLGLRALGELAAQHPERIHGPIITTNFDPLLEIAVRVARGEAFPWSLPSDGSLRQAIDNSGGDVLHVAHVHGYWNGEGHTLHSAARLKQERPMLATSLGELLTSHLVVVIGYGAWEDVFTSALRQALETGRDVEVVWCLFRHPVEPFTPGTVLQLASAGDALQIYSDIDANSVLPILAANHHPDPVKRLASRMGSRPRLVSPAVSDPLGQAIASGQLRLLRTAAAADHPDVVVWPHRLREPNAVHLAQALVARALLSTGSTVLVVINDLGTQDGDPLARRFEDTILRWTCGDERSDALVFQHLRDPHILFPRNLSYDQVRDVLEAATDVESNIVDALQTELDAGRPVRWHQLLSPLAYWTYLLTLPDRGLALNRVWTLGGEHHAAAWEQFDEGVRSEVGHLLVPSPRNGDGDWLVDGPALCGDAEALRELGAPVVERLAGWVRRQLVELPALLAPTADVQGGAQGVEPAGGDADASVVEPLAAQLRLLLSEGDSPRREDRR